MGKKVDGMKMLAKRMKNRRKVRNRVTGGRGSENVNILEDDYFITMFF
jgi:hypothetical protein